MNKGELLKTLLIGQTLMSGSQSVSKAMMPTSLNEFGRRVITRSIHVTLLALSF
jgi:hypothetical protein